MFEGVLSLFSFMRFSFQQMFWNYRNFVSAHLSFLLVFCILWSLGALVGMGQNAIEGYKKDLEEEMALTFYLSPNVSEPIRDHLLVELQERSYIEGVDFTSSKQAQTYLTQKMGVESLNQYLDKDPLPSKVRVFFKAKTKLDSLRSLVSDLEGSMYVKHIKFDVQNWMVFQGRVWFLDFFSPFAWFVILLFSWINISLCIEKCFVSSQWLAYWRRMGASYNRIRLQIILTLLFSPVCLYALLLINPVQNLFVGALSHYGHNLKYTVWQSYIMYSLCYQILLVILSALINISFRKMTNN